jgi:hypothetical protein
MIRFVLAAVWIGLLAVYAERCEAQTAAVRPGAAAPAAKTELPPPAAFEQALPLYLAEFGKDLAPDRAQRLYAAHLLIEEYFGEIPTSRRAAVVGEVEKIGVTPEEVARLCRIRLAWRPVEPGVYYVSDQVGAIPVHYFVGIPQGYTPETARPAILMLPTATAFVARRPNAELNPDQVAAVYTGWIQSELRARPGNIIIMPLLHLTELWGPGYAGMNNAIKPLLNACERFAIDPARVYLRGQGMSGHAVWNLGFHYPTYFAAINPLAGSAKYDWQRARAINLRNTLVVTWHDSADKSVPIQSTKDLVALLRRNKVDVVFEETKGLGHVPGPDVDQRLYDLMIARKKDLNPRSVSLRSTRPDVAFLRNEWVQVWQPDNAGPETRHIFRWGGSGMWTFQNTLTVEAKVAGARGTSAGNRIDITSTNLGPFRLLLNNDLLDLSRPMSVTVNRRTLYEGPLAANIRDTLESQLLVGRGWRAYTVALNLNESPPTTRPTSRPASGPGQER